ncbi:MAG: tRNA-dihydrouridine synthase family protein [Bacteroidales bacterium]|nr:tRNA-dihydrouridine synthase family protein [Bacteroidales bacterium]
MNIQNDKSIHFAPLQGHTDHFYRNVHNEIFGGIDTYYTPFVRLEKGDTYRPREIRDINPENNTVEHLIPQLIASTGEELKKISALFIEKGYKEADINMGCPFPMIARRHKGSGILAHHDEVKALLDTVNVIPELRFSLKIRLGWDSPEEAINLISLINDSNISHLCVHARLGKQQYGGETDLDSFEKIYNASSHPLFYNGDVKTIEDIDNIFNRFPNLKGVTIGRGLLSNPALAMEYKSGSELSVSDKKKKMRLFHDTLFQHYSDFLQGEKQILDKMKAFWEYLSPELEKRTRKKIEKANKLNNYDAAVSLAFSQWGKVAKVEDNQDSEDFI